MTRRSLSIPVFCASLVVAALAGGGFHFVRQWQLARLSQTLLHRAGQEEDRQNWPKAVELLDRYLRLQPQRQAARARLAFAFARGAVTVAEKQRAVALHYQALGSHQRDHELELRISLAELLLETDRLLEAESEAKGVLERQPGEPRASRVFALSRYFQWSRGALSSKRPTELRLLHSIEEALRKNPDDIALAETAATLYRDFPDVVAAQKSGLNQHAREQIADGFLDRLVQRMPNSAKAFLSRHTYRARYKLVGSQQDLDTAIQLDPADPQVVLAAARAAFHDARAALPTGAVDRSLDEPQVAAANEAALEKLDAAQAYFQQLIDKDLLPGSVEPHLRLGDIRMLRGELDDAVAAWQNALTSFAKPTDQVKFHSRIADELLRAGRIDQARASLDSIETILATIGGTVSRRQHLELMQAQGLRRATYLLHRGRYWDTIAEAQLAIARQPQLTPDPATSQFAWDLLGRGFAGLEDWTEAATAFDRAANFQAHAVGPRLAAARSWLMAGRGDLAIDRAEQVTLIEDSAEAWIILGTAELQAQSIALPVDRSWKRVQTALDRLARISPAEIDAPWRIDFLRADYIALRSQSEADPNYSAAAAAAALRLAEAKYEGGSQFWFAACLAYERLKHPQDAERAWQRLSEFPGAQTEAAIAASRRAAIHSDFAAAHRILEDASQSAPEAGRGRLRQELIRVAQARQDLPQMRKLLLAELRQRPRDVGVLRQLAELDLRDGDLAALRGWEVKLAAAGYLGESWAGYFRAIRLYSSAKGPGDPVLHEALAEQARLVTLRPNWPQSYALRGAIEQRLGRLAAAVAAYEQAVALGESRYSVFEQLIECLDKLHRYTDVEKYLARLEAYLPSSQSLTEIAAHRQLDSDRPEQAVEIARRAAAKRPGDLRTQLWLGRLLLLTNRLDEAHRVFEQATQSSPQDVRSWNGLFAYFLKTGEKEQARNVLESIRRQAKLDPVELDLVLGQAYMRLGEGAEAMRLMAKLSEKAPDRADVYLQLARLHLDTDREKAKEHLQKAIDLDPKLAQARWMLAALLSAGGSEADLAQAKELLGDAGGEATVDDRRVRALLLAQHGDADGLGRAVRILEQIVHEDGEHSSDRLLLARLYERQAEATSDAAKADARLKAAREQLVAVAGRTGAQPADMGLLVAFLLRHKYSVDAGVWLDRLEAQMRTSSKHDPQAIALLIDLRIKHGTVEQCEPWIARLESIDADPVRPLAARVKLLMARGQRDQIESIVETKAKAALELIVDAKTRLRIARAIGDLYTVANMLSGAERWYRIVVREDQDQFPVLALTLVRQGRVREAIRLCQSATDHDSTSRPAVVLASILLEAGGKPEHTEIAEPMLAEALAKFPDDASLLYGIGMLRVLADRYEEAIEHLRRVVKLQPRHVAALNNLAVIVAETPDQRQEAAQFIEQAIDLRGQQSTLLDTQGSILLFSGRSSDAIELLEAAARGIDPDPRHRFHLAIAYQDVGNAAGAREQLDEALAHGLEKQILTPTDRKLLARLRTSLDAPSHRPKL